MFVNGLENVSFCFISEENMSFVCNYARTLEPRVYSYHSKGGFISYRDAMAWYFEKFPNGNVVSQSEFISLQNQLLTVKPPGPQHFNPLYMEGLDRVGPKKSSDGSIQSEFE